MSTEISEKLYTLKEFLNLEWPDDDDNDYELIGGRIVARPKSGVSGEHGRIVAKITYRLESFAGDGAGEKALGQIYSGASSTLGRPEGSSYVEPDVCFVLNGRTPPKFPGSIPVAPDIAVEVWSPTDTTQKIQDKIDAYLQSGVRLIWSIYMVSKYILVYTLNDPDVKFLNLKGELDGGEVLPGFKLAIKELFE